MTNSQNGYPALAPGDPRLHTWVVPGTNNKVKLPTRVGPEGFLLTLLASYLHEYVENIVTNYNGVDDWGYANRLIRGSTQTVSNHGSATAIDLNATDHPLGKRNTYNRKQMEMIRHILKIFKGCIRWGGDYSGRADEMHFEINRSPWAVKRVAKRLAKTPRGEMVLRANESQRFAVTGRKVA